MRYLYLIILGGLFGPSCQQATPVENNNQHRLVYEQAMGNGDFTTAAQAIYYLNAVEPSSDLMDTLALLYVKANNYDSAVHVAKKSLEDQPNNELMLKVLASSYRIKGEGIKAVDAYADLYTNSKDIHHLYDLASLQYSIKRLEECQLSLKAILNHPELVQSKVVLNFDKTSQQVPMKAATYNLLGVLAKELNLPDQAKESFNKALAEYPNFRLAKGNLNSM